MSVAKTTELQPIPIEVRSAKGSWHAGFLLLSFLADGTVKARSEYTGQVRHLEQGQWRDPIEEEILARSTQQEAQEEGWEAQADRGCTEPVPASVGALEELTPARPKSEMSVLELLRMGSK